MDVQELQFAATVRSLASEMFDEERAVAIVAIQRAYSEDSRAAQVKQWDSDNPFSAFTVKALRELELVASIIRQQRAQTE